MENIQGQAERALKNELTRALEQSSELIQETQDLPKNSSLSLIRRGFLFSTLSATWGQGHLDTLAGFAINAEVLGPQEQLVGFKFKQRLTLINSDQLDSSKRPKYLDGKDLGRIYVELGGSKEKAKRLFPGFETT